MPKHYKKTFTNNKQINNANFIKFKKIMTKEIINQDRDDLDSLLHCSKLTNEFISSDEFEKMIEWK